MRVLSLLVLFAGSVSVAQPVRFVPVLSGRPLALDRPGLLPDGTPVTITQFRFYAGRFQFYRNGHVVLQDSSYRLMDIADSNSLIVPTPLGASPVDSISFLFGVDSLTNVSGAFGGDLDPIKGMYWTWNSGYINLKLEGTSPVSPYASHQFELHLGGYLPPHTTARPIVVKVDKRTPFDVNVELAPLLVAADLRTRCNLMQPGARAAELARIASTLFSAHERP